MPCAVLPVLARQGFVRLPKLVNAQSRAALPENAGPLNSQHLVHRALVLMRELSPEYLEHFVGYIDALQWMAQVNEAATQELTNARAAQARPRSQAARRG